MPRFHWTRLWPVLLIAGVALVFGRALPFPFVYDDRWTLAENPSLQSPTPLQRFFTDRDTVAAPSTGMGHTIYRPIPTLTYSWDSALGLAPARLRAENLAIHAGNGVLLFALLRLLAFSQGAAGLAAAGFLFHPAQVESVVWLTQRSNLLCLAGLLLAFLFVRLRRPLAAATAFLLGLFSKETAVMGAVLLPLFLRIPPAPEKRRRRNSYLAAVALAAAYIAIRWEVVGPPAQRALRESWAANLLVGMASWWEYLKILILPIHLRVSYAQNVLNPWRNFDSWWGLGLLFACIAAVPVLARKDRRLGFFLAWVPLTLAPVLGFFPTDTFVAERFLYVPLVGAVGLLAWCYDRWRLSRGILAAVVLAWAGLSFAQTNHWRSELALWNQATRAEPKNAFAQLCRAQALEEVGRKMEAEGAYRRALELGLTRPQAAAALTDLSALRLAAGDPADALRWADSAVEAGPDLPAARLNRVRALALVGRRREALEELDALAALAPPKDQWENLRRQVEAIPEGGGIP